MVITVQKDIRDVEQFLVPGSKVFIVGCGECATVCNTGGEKEVLQTKEKLEKDGFVVTGFSVPDAPCNNVQIRRCFRENKDLLGKSDSIVVLACGLGAQSIKDHLDSSVKEKDAKIDIHIGCDTLGMGQTAKNNKFPETCVGCGDCILSFTGGICPIANCAKSLMNGPCGGQDKGKCEINKEKDCAWIKIYETLKEKDQLYLLEQIRPAKGNLRVFRQKQAKNL